MVLKSPDCICLVLIFASAGCSKASEEQAWPKEVEAAPLAQRGTPYPSDPNATFEILSTRKLTNGHLEVINRRDGPSGVSFSRREISCSEYTYRYLGEGDTLEEAMRDSPNQGSMSALTGTSASSDVADAACAKQ